MVSKEDKRFNDIASQIDKMPFIERKKPIEDFTPPTVILGKKKKDRPKIVSLADRIRQDDSEIIKKKEEKIEDDFIEVDSLEDDAIDKVEVKDKPKIIRKIKQITPESEYDELNKETSVERDIVISGEQKQPSDLILSLNMLLDDKNIKGKTILDNRQVTAITLMNWAGQVYDIAFLNEFVHNWCRYRISGDGGKGRQDLISIAQAIQLQENKKFEDYQSLMKK